MRTVVIDTGLYLACSVLNGRSSGKSNRIVVLDALAVQLGATLVTSAAVVVEAAQHTSSYLHRARSAWDRDRAVAFFGWFFVAVRSHELAAPTALAAIENVSRCRQNVGAGSRRRSTPSVNDGLTAEVLRELQAAILISDHGKDFAALLPDCDFEQLSVTAALRLAGAGVGGRCRRPGLGL